jgi:hypothetical protein
MLTVVLKDRPSEGASGGRIRDVHPLVYGVDEEGQRLLPRHPERGEGSLGAASALGEERSFAFGLRMTMEMCASSTDDGCGRCR